MLLPVKMKRVHLLVTRDEAPQAAMLLSRLGMFESDSDTAYSEELPEMPAESYQLMLKDAAAYLDKILYFLGQSLKPHQGPLPPPPSHDELGEVAEFLASEWRRFSQMEEQERQLQEEDKRIRQLETSLESFSALEIDLGLLNAEHSFLDIRVGTVPLENMERLREAVGLADYRLETFHREQEMAHTLIAGPKENVEQVARALDAAAWHPQTVPGEFAGYPEQVHRDLEAAREPIRREREAQEEQRCKAWRSLEKKLQDSASTLMAAAPYAQLGGSLHGRGALTLLAGWVPADDLATLERELNETLQGRYFISSRDPDPAERDAVPTALRHHRWLAPFIDLVGNYGMPRYGELDPTVLFALTFVAMFGMMFGDVGHGLVIALGGLLMHRRLGRVVPFLVMCGASSMFFGVLYGSVFGFEELFHPLWISPLSDPVLMLMVALFAGAFLIAIATLLAIRNQLVDGKVLQALLGGKGVAGLVLYAGLGYIGYRLGNGQPAGQFAPVLTTLAALSILSYIWFENGESSLPERMLITVIEGFDTLMGYISGTLSFLRIAAFSLNHVALAIAVFTIANSLDAFGYWLTVVIGNVVIIVLEGAIVMIQALRLEYYEGFSRFFSGSGHAFRPLRLQQPFNSMRQNTRTTP